jgi:hypothetical protein
MTFARALLLAAPLSFLVACNGPARVALEPTSVRLFGRGQLAKLHAVPTDKRGETLSLDLCTWSSSDEKVATVSGPGSNDAVVTAVAPGSAVIRCLVGSITGEAQVTVRVVGRISVSPSVAELKLLDEPAPVALQIEAYDTDGRLVSNRVPLTGCADESVCRGDNRGQLWAVGAGTSKVTVQVDDAKAELTAHVTDARSADGKPKAVKGNPMLIYDKMFGEGAEKAKAKKKR